MWPHHSSVVAPLPTHGRNFSPAKTAACHAGNLPPAATAASHPPLENRSILTRGAAPSHHRPHSSMAAALYGRSCVGEQRRNVSNKRRAGNLGNETSSYAFYAYPYRNLL